MGFLLFIMLTIHQYRTFNHLIFQRHTNFLWWRKWKLCLNNKFAVSHNDIVALISCKVIQRKKISKSGFMNLCSIIFSMSLSALLANINQLCISIECTIPVFTVLRINKQECKQKQNVCLFEFDLRLIICKVVVETFCFIINFLHLSIFLNQLKVCF